MIVPTKGVAPQRALLAVGAQIVMATDRQPVTVTQAWQRLLTWREDNNHRAPVTFWWFALALDLLYALGLVELEQDILIFQARDNAA
ncbi:ABC-three component system middle component 6 [Streptosporangium amethystogenes subsp. fukuiense]|uniref:ABC-three component system middle component 6 n=1 Tax=Streptosporangium amethystogenes subsp. fukuiense TaxID=698418 RepID=A0ABW2T4D2_9ACTN